MTELIHRHVEKPDRIEQNTEITLGDWYWIDKEIACVSGLGSNYARMKWPDGRFRRVHFKDFFQQCTFEPDPQSVIESRCKKHQDEIRYLTSEVQELCSRLGVSPTRRLTESSTALAVSSGTGKVEEYKNALIKAEKDELPALFKKIKEEHEELATWMSAATLSFKAQIGEMGGIIKKVQDRIFDVGLYAGLSEWAEKVADGVPAPMDAKLHLFQRMAFMDEECLLDYQHGGMEFRDIRKFDEWLAKPKNRDRLLPFPRCMVVFQVRRNRKERYANDLQTAFINFQLAQDDTLTFLYIRNGDQLFRVNTELDFSHFLFPDRDEFDFDEPLMVNKSDQKTIPVRDHEERVRNERIKRKLDQIRERKLKAWLAENPDSTSWDAPRELRQDYRTRFEPRNWEPLNEDSVYLDDVNEKVQDQVRFYNRICTILQGLLDRSLALHPHPPIQLWKPEQFSQFVQLVYDSDRCLHHGDPPDFAAYEAKLRESLGNGSVTIGQHDAWYESLPRKYEYSRHGGDRQVVVKAWTDNGPERMTRIDEWKPRSRKAVFKWTRDRARYYRYGDNSPINCRFECPAEKLFNVSAYKPGDYLQFFNDPRTRRDYLRWAHLLLTAEEFHAGNLDRKGQLRNDEPE